MFQYVRKGGSFYLVTVKRSLVKGCGAFLPERVLTNEGLACFVDTDDSWIRQRTGIEERRIAAKGETTASIALESARAALHDAGVEVSEVDLIILATTTPNRTFPSTAVEVQAGLGMLHGAAFDLQAVCSGFIYALVTADSYLRAGLAQSVLVIGAETLSRLLDWQDRTSCVLFGDGGGALFLKAELQPGEGSDRGILASKLRSDGRYKDKLYTDGGPSTTGTVGRVRMEGREVFKHAVTLLSDLVTELLEEAGLGIQDIDWFVPHQANRRIIESVARKLSLPKGKVIVTIEKHANTSAASVPLALHSACREGKIRPGHLILLEAMGAGFTWGAVLLRW